MSHKTGNADFGNIGMVDTSKITLGQYHKISLRQDEANGVYHVKFYFDDELIGTQTNYVPELTFTNVRIHTTGKDDFDLSFKELDYSGSD